MNPFRRSFALATLAAAFVPLAHADFINGSFETPTAPFGNGTFVSTATLTGWTVNNGSYLVGNGAPNTNPSHDSTTWWNTPAGSQFLYVNPSVGTQSVSQSVALAAGANSLSFLLADFASQFSSPGGQILVSIVRDSNAQSIVSSQLFATPNFSPFVQETLPFTAPAAGNYTFTFQGVSGHAGNIDAVILNPTPEPATLAALGLGAVAFVRRRRRA